MTKGLITLPWQLIRLFHLKVRNTNGMWIGVVKSKIIYLLVASFSLLTIHSSSGQNTKDSLYSIWSNNANLKSVRADSYNKLIREHYLGSKPDSAYVMATRLLKFTLNNNLELQVADVKCTFGDIYYKLADFNESLKFYTQSLKIYKKLNHKKGLGVINANLSALSTFNFDFNKSLEYSQESLRNFQELKDTLNMSKSYLDIGNAYNNKYQLKEALNYFNKSLKLAESINAVKFLPIIYVKLGENLENGKDYKKAMIFYHKALAFALDFKDLEQQRYIMFAMSSCSMKQENYDECIMYAQKSFEIDEILGDNMHSITNQYNTSDAYKAKGNLEMAYIHLEKASSLDSQFAQFNSRKQLEAMELDNMKIRDSLQQFEKALKIKTEHDFEILKKDEEKAILIYGWGGSITALSLVALLLFQNNKRKHKINAQAKEIELQKKDKELKVLELSSIDAIVEGQEKERQRIANELHDDLGALMATVKLNFNALEDEKSPELYGKTNDLIEEAYQKIRTVAHSKNYGVLAKQGIIKALNNMTESISASNRIKVEVIHQNFDIRLDTSLELSLFRIVQELITNVIKHSEATEAIVSIIEHKNSINIMVEDNGKGFIPNGAMDSGNGMGLNSIDKRVDHLNGTMHIESIPSKGTTVIIDIPL